MNKTDWTSADYREVSKLLAIGDIMLPVAKVRSMLDFAANRIEQDERAVPVAWMTHHDDPMLFTTAEDAAAYCDDDEIPIALFTHPPAQAAQVDTVHAWPKFVQDECLEVLRNVNTELSATGRKSARIETLINAIAGMPTAEPVAQGDSDLTDARFYHELAELRKAQGLDAGDTLKKEAMPRCWDAHGNPCCDVHAWGDSPTHTQPHSPDASDSGRVCPHCDGTGDVHSIDGEWRGECTACPAAMEHSFKNFHRQLCERFGYTHDEKGWRRDQVSLIEFLAAQPQSAASPVGVPDGWFQVPHQPTAEMFNAALSACALAGVLITCNMLCAIYQSMLAAAPSATPEGGK